MRWAWLAIPVALVGLVAYGYAAGGESRPSPQAVSATVEARDIARAKARICGETLGTGECERRWDAELTRPR